MATGRRSQPTAHGQLGGRLPTSHDQISARGGWRCARFAIGTVEKIAKRVREGRLAMISFFVFKWSLTGATIMLGCPFLHQPRQTVMSRTAAYRYTYLNYFP